MGPASRRLPDVPRPLRLDRLDFPSGLNVLILAPHPDDFDETGLTLRRLHGRGARLRLLVCSSSANGVEDAFVDPPTAEAKAAVREKEQIESLAFFGLDAAATSFLRLPVGEGGGFLVDAPESFEIVAAEARNFRPDLVFLPYGRDTNPDHRLVFSWWQKIRADRASGAQALLFRDPKTISLREDAIFGFGEEEAAWKRRLLLHHRSQDARNIRTRGHGFDKRILGVNRSAALSLGLDLPYAEVFQID
jgi:LmbE family N-acetylglucosaminyl deacetylase